VLGLRIAPPKSLLVPTAHDEPAIRLGLYEDVFSAAAGIAWNTDVERRFVSEHFHLRTIVEDIVGCGVDLPDEATARHSGLSPTPPATREPLPPHLEGPANAFRRRHRLHDPFVLYGGRIDPGKGCEELLEYFQTYVRDGGNATLVLMGAKLMPIPEDPHVRFAGMLPDEERLHALEAASVVVVPSPYESLSLLALEAFAVGTPVLANARAEVLVEHCRRSQAGLYYADRWEFVETLKLLMRQSDLRVQMGKNGQTYINRHYRWGLILQKYDRLLNRIKGSSELRRPTETPQPVRRVEGPRSGERPDRRRFEGRRDQRRGSRRGPDRMRGRNRS
jgi:glycosyltransferase involved in cell wall biosynthesis